MEQIHEFTLNGKPVRVEAPPDRMLLWVLRIDFGLTGTKYGCGEAFCGACTVLVDGEAVPSCQTPIAQAAGRKVVTIEGLAKDGVLHPLQAAFLEHDALQCGFCTPGMILKVVGLMAANPIPSRSEIAAALEDNLCRCGNHERIVRAAETASRTAKGARP